mgnify:CR=1 FL=1
MIELQYVMTSKNFEMTIMVLKKKIKLESKTMHVITLKEFLTISIVN